MLPHALFRIPLRHGLLAVAAAVLSFGAGTAAIAQSGPVVWERPPCPIGRWDGSEPELSAALQLGADGRFRYAMTYGALDEQAEGRWQERPTANGAGIVLTSDPFVPPRFVFVDETPGDAPILRVDLIVPDGISRQFFEGIVTFADGRSRIRRFAEDGLELSLDPADRPVSLALVVPVLGLQGERMPVSGKGGTIRVRFEPNELGKVAFADTPLNGSAGDLLLERHGREIRFRRSGGGCGAKFP